ncbi:glycoside hydrolase family 76 protein [uncultured Dysgonomonas sp.]|uniref:Ricin B lectin domain-containing protein n=1 Tax=uncultured Dysgonomonas sp. TaxID=206096 RepID=A0A212JVI6_9BACT|nr:glycoside hydrolase family 76 protein [uncultured Dysgonomonas sp.]SBW03469.1 conserved exported hypothetical protein [uncultured Dysgonomonas sp.]
MKKIRLWAILVITALISCSSTDPVFVAEGSLAPELISGAVYRITPYLDESKSISVKDASFSDATGIVAWTETNVNSQRWRLNKDESGNFYYLTNVYTGKSMHIDSPASLGANVKQYTKENTYNYKWIISETEESGVYFLNTALLASENKLYLEISKNSDGSNIEEGVAVKTFIKRNGEDASLQKWKLERVSEVPNRFTSAMRDEMVRAWKAQYYRKAQNVGYTLSDANRLANESHVWQDSEIFEIVLDAYETTADASFKDMFDQLYRNFIYENGSNWLYNPFNDDITWMVIACVRAHLLFGNQEYLNVAVENFTQMYDRALMPEGCLRWCEKEEERIKTNSCINSPAIVAACYLAQATGDVSYYEKAKGVYDKQAQYLYDVATGMVYDCVTTDHFNPWKWASTYNQGTFLGASMMLYEYYGDNTYKENMQKTAEYTIQHFSDNNNILFTPDENGANDRPGFKGILMRYMRQFINNYEIPGYADWMEACALQAYNNKNTKGLVWTDWTKKATENMVYESANTTEYYATDPWGTSTAVSIAVNLPLIQK